MAQPLSSRLGPLALFAAVPGPHDGARASVPGKNGRIAFTREGPGGLTNVMALKLGGGGEAAVSPAGGFDAAPD